MNREEKIRLLKEIVYRLLTIVTCTGTAFLVAWIAGTMEQGAYARGEQLKTLPALYFLIITAFTVQFVGICVAVGNRGPAWSYLLFGAAIALLPVIVMPALTPLGVFYPAAVACLNAVLAAGLHHALLKLLDRLILGPATE